MSGCYRQAPTTWNAARNCIKPDHHIAQFSPEEMQTEWQDIWTTDPSVDEAQFAHNWRDHATNQAPPASPKPPDWLPDLHGFSATCRIAKGSPGLDGWTAPELRGLSIVLPTLIEELHLLWTRTANQASTTIQHNDHHAEHNDTPHEPTNTAFFKTHYHIRVAGLPKRSDYKSRPISVLSILARAYHRALLPAMPPPRIPNHLCLDFVKLLRRVLYQLLA